MSASAAVWYMLAGLAIWSAARALHGALIVRRSRTWKLAVTVAGLGLGAAPALDRRPVGYALVAAGGLASVSLVSEVAERRGWFAPRGAHKSQQVTSPELAPDRYGHGRRLTELDQAAVHLAALGIEHDRLERAAITGDLREQHAAATAIGRVAGQLRSAVAVVIRERALLDRPR
jgi:hypothetical protein